MATAEKKPHDRLQSVVVTPSAHCSTNLPRLASIVSRDYSVEGVVLDDPDNDLILAAALESQAS